MKKQTGTEYYSFAKSEWIDTRKSMASWDYGRKRALPFWPEFVAKGYYYGDGFFKHHRPTSTAFELPLSGELLLEHGEKNIPVGPGELYILPVGEPNTLRAGSTGECWKISAGFCGQMIEPTLAALGLANGRNRIRLTEPERILKLMERMFELLREQNTESVAELAGLVVQLFTETGRQAAELPPPQVADAVRIFEFNLAAPITLREVAAELKLAEYKLIRLFRNHYDMTPMEFLGELRMRKAAAMLRNSAMPVGEIAQSCGYALPRSFCREFGKQFGETPLTYRKKLKIEN